MPMIFALLLAALPPGLQFGQSLRQGLAAMEPRCASVRQVDVAPPSYPLAREQESHLICQDYRHQGVAIDVMALTYADSGLSLVFARGNVAQLKSLASGEFQPYLHFEASFEDLLVLDPQSDQAWLMSDAAAHPNLFLWSNPYVDAAASPRYSASVDASDILPFGQSLEILEPMFAARCDFKHSTSFPVWLLSAPEKQQQIDCFGYELAGFPRKIEAVFGDGILQQAWILTGAGEEDRVRKALIETYGKPIYVDAAWEIFGEGQVMLRKDKPEVLMLSETLAPLFRAHHIDATPKP